MDVVYMRPESSLAGYDGIWPGPITINFRRGWERATGAGTRWLLIGERAMTA
jgi:hypothetical protein